MNSIKNKKIAIVGGGPGGLTLARILQLRGALVNVYERDLHKDARMQGATLDLHEESGLLALQEAGLMDAFRANYRPGADKLRLVDKNATIILDDHAGESSETTRPEIDRGPLQNILQESLQPGTIIWDSHFKSLTQQNNSWKLEFQNGKAVIADIVIGADGANSRIRPYITPVKPFFAGVTAIEGAVYNSATASPKIHALLKGGKIFALADSKSLIVSSKGDGSLGFYTTLNTTEFWWKESGIDFTDKTQVLEWFKKEYTGWDNIWFELFENASTHFIVRPQYCMPLNQHWDTLHNLTIIGDAAHLMPPFAGEGVNMAMLDALELGKCLSNEDFTDTQAGIASYESQMLLRASVVADQTMLSTKALHSPEGINFFMQILTGAPD